MIDLKPDHAEIVSRILAEHVPECEVRAFGSRVAGSAREYSDLDLAVVGEGPLELGVISRLNEAFEESSLPMQVDVLDWHSIPDRFKKEIEQNYVPIRRRIEPTVWKKTNVGDFTPFKYGKSLPARKRDPRGEIPVFGSNGIVGYHSSALTEGPAIVIGRKGTVGAVHYSPNPCWPIDTTFYITGTDPELMRYKYFTLRSLGFEKMNSDSAVPGLNRLAAHARELMLPQEREQRRIGQMLGTLDDKIDLNHRMNEILEEMARTLFKSWFVDFDPVHAKMEGRWQPSQSLPGLPAHLYDLFPNRLMPSQLGPIPRGWKVRPLGHMVELAYGKGLRAQSRRPGSVPVYGSNGRVGWHDRKLVDGPGIVVGRKGNPGFVTLSPTDFYPIDTTFYVIPRDAKASLHFLFHALEAQDLPAIAADSAVPGLNRNLAYMNKQVIPAPQVVEKFDECVGPLFSAHYHLGKETRTVAAIRDVLLPELVSGALRVAG